jgi:hypothetical protein
MGGGSALDLLPREPEARPPEEAFEGAVMRPARPKEGFADMVMGTKYSDMANRPPVEGMMASNLGASPQQAAGVQQAIDLLYEVMEAKGAQGSRSAMLGRPAPGGRQPSYRRSGEEMAKAMGMGEDAPSRLMDTRKGFNEESYPYVETVKVFWEDGQVHTDQIKGLNKGHAMQRARANWPDAAWIESIPEEHLGKADRSGNY